MTPTYLTLLLSGILLLAALGGPWLLRQAAPALSSVPRFAFSALTVTAILWVAALVTLGPIVAWISNGPAWLPHQAAEVCSRCLSAASPFGESALSLGIPPLVPLALPLLGALATGLGLIREFRNVKRSQSALAATIRENSDAMNLLGYRVRVTREDRPLAFSLPHRHDGITVSRGAIAALSSTELSAVLAHEHAHQAQRHHFILAFLNGATHYFRWIPFIRTVRETVPHYIEIAADQAAKSMTGTTALAGALLKLGQPVTPETASPVAAHVALHAAGSERIRHLLGLPRPRASLALAAAAGAYAFMLAAAALVVHWPYLLTVLTGC